MKGLGFFDKLIFILNTLVAFLLLLSYGLPYIPPDRFPIISVLSLGVPLLLILNLLFMLFWAIRLKKQMLLSLVVLVLGYNYISSFYKISSGDIAQNPGDFTLMSYNVRLFNIFEWLPSKSVKTDIVSFIENKQPDILCLQEYRQGSPIELSGYYNFNARYDSEIKGGQTIFSKFPIVNSGSLEFPNTNNNAIFADIKIESDTIRVYNIHLQSSGINTEVEALKSEGSENLLNRLSSTFKRQQEQAKLVLKHQESCPYKVVIAGDFNNTAFSYAYNSLRGDLVDAFDEAGRGFGRTFVFKFFPVRIDFILADEAIAINGYTSFKEELSDHYPIMAKLNLNQ